MNKSVDERLVPPGQYINAINVRLGSTETTEIGAVENSKGNTQLATLAYGGQNLSVSAVCIGAYEDGSNETIYWFIHDANNPVAGGKLDLIVSFNIKNQAITYHIISKIVLSFDPKFLITGVDKIEDLLFFTDDKNPPRKINVTQTYPDPAGINDGIIESDISVVLKPPGFNALGELAAPKITMLNEEPFFITSKYATYNNINYETTFFNKVKINYLDNIINSEKFSISITNNFAKVSENVIYQNKEVKLEADTIEIDLITKNSKIFMTEKNKKIKIIKK